MNAPMIAKSLNDQARSFRAGDDSAYMSEESLDCANKYAQWAEACAPLEGGHADLE